MPTLREVFEKLLPAAVQSGVDIKDFWNYTLAEIQIYINNYSEREKARARETALFSYNLAAMTASFIGKGLAGKELPDVGEIYPDLADISQKAKIEEFKKNMLAFTEMHNQQRRA